MYNEFHWFANTNITEGEWYHLALNLLGSQGFVEFIINGERADSCGGNPEFLGVGDCPDVVSTEFTSATDAGYLILGGHYRGPLLSNMQEDFFAPLWIDELLFFSEKLDTAEVHGIYSNGSLGCTLADARLIRCFRFDEPFSGTSSEEILDGSILARHANGFGMASQEGVTGLSNLSTTIFASSGNGLLLKVNRSNLDSSFVATYDVMYCECTNGLCIRGVCVCSPGFGGETCEEVLVRDACTEGNGTLYGAEYDDEFGYMSLDIMRPDYNRLIVQLYPKLEHQVFVPQINCHWYISRDYAIAGLDWTSFGQCFHGEATLVVSYGINNADTAKENLYFPLNDANLMSIEGTTGELEVTLKSANSALWQCISDASQHNHVHLKYTAPKVLYVSPNDDFLSTVQIRTGTHDAPFNTISDALASASNNDIIMLYPGRYEGSENVNIEISIPVTIRGISGIDYTILDANAESYHFTISTIGNVVFEGISFQNGYSKTLGSSLRIYQGNVIVKNCIFQNNIATTGGTLLVVSPGSLDMISATMQSNKVGSYASAILSHSAKLSFTDCIFKTNEAGNYGTIVLMRINFEAVATFTNCSFVANTAHSRAVISILDGMTADIQDCRFLKNIALTGSGAVIYGSSGSILRIASSELIENTAARKGAAIWLDSGSSFIAENILVTKNTNLYEDGGALYAFNTHMNRIINSVFLNNYGGSVLIEESSGFDLYNNTFSNNMVFSLLISESAGTLSSSLFLNNSGINGPAIHFFRCNLVSVSKCLFKNNHAHGNGGAVYNLGSSVLMASNLFSSNTASLNGGSAYFEKTYQLHQVLEGNIFVSSEAENGGCIGFYYATNVTGDGNEFTNCTATSDGGALFLDESKAQFHDFSITGSKSGWNGGGIVAMADSELTLVHAIIHGCHSQIGGAVSVKSQSVCLIFGGSFAFNSAAYGGALAVNEESDVSLAGKTIFSDNIAQEDGGALYLVRVTTTGNVINGTEFTNNAALGLGGAVFIALSDAMYFDGVFADSNTAASGAHMAVLASLLSINNSNIEYGTSSQGGLYILHSTFQMFNTRICCAQAEENGALIYAFASNMIIGSCSLTNGTSFSNGGGTFLFDSASIDCHNTSFDGNYAESFGGALFISGTATIDISYSRFTNNHAGIGGAVHYQESDALTLTSCHFAHNEAVIEGGGILCEDSNDVNVVNSTFSKNWVTGGIVSDLYGGGAMRISSVGSFSAFDSIFMDNGTPDDEEDSYLYGGAMYIDYSSVSVLRCTFKGNNALNGGAVYLGEDPVQSSRRLLKSSYERWMFRKHPKGNKAMLQRYLPGDPGDSNEENIRITGCNFEQNFASSGGGALSYSGSEPFGLQDNVFQMNNALYGSEFTTPAAFLTASHNTSVLERSGYVVSTILVEVRDIYGQIVSSLNGADVFCETTEATISGSASEVVSSGIASFDSMIVTKTPGSAAELHFTAPAIVEGNATIEITFRPCIPGEVIQQGTGVCVRCSYGTFSLDPTDSYCHECPDGAVCYGGSQIKALAGYWRFPDSTGVCEPGTNDGCYFHGCLQPGACLGDILISENIQISAMSPNQLTFSGNKPYEYLQDYCWDPSTCNFDLEGYSVRVEKFTSDTITLDSPSTALVSLLIAEQSAKSAFILHLKQSEMCGEAYTGNLCANCAVGFGLGMKNECKQCPSSLLLSYVFFGLGIAAIITVATVMIRTQISADTSGNERMSIIFKIITSYLQLVGLFSALELSWPELVIGMFNCFDIISRVSEKVISLDCIFNNVLHYNSDDDSFCLFYKKLTFFMVEPVITVLGCIGFYYFCYAFKRLQMIRNPWDYATKPELEKLEEDGMVGESEVCRVLQSFGEKDDRSRVESILRNLEVYDKGDIPLSHFQQAYVAAYGKALKENCILSIVILLFMIYPNVAQYTFYVFTCTELETGLWFLQQDLDTECNTDMHNMWRYGCGIPFLFIYTAGIPILAFLILNRHKDEISSPHVKQQYGFLYDGYEEKYYYWEFWVMARKLCITAALVFLSPYGVAMEALTGFVVACAATVAHLHCQPYEDQSLDTLESFSLFVTVATLLCGLFFYSDEMQESGRYFFIVLVLVMNGGFILYFMAFSYTEYTQHLIDSKNDYIQQVHDKLAFLTSLTKSEKELEKEKQEELAEQRFGELLLERCETQDDFMMRQAEICSMERNIKEMSKEKHKKKTEIEMLDLKISRVLQRPEVIHLTQGARGKAIVQKLEQVSSNYAKDMDEDISSFYSPTQSTDYKTCRVDEQEELRKRFTEILSAQLRNKLRDDEVSIPIENLKRWQSDTGNEDLLSK